MSPFKIRFALFFSLLLLLLPILGMTQTVLGDDEPFDYSTPKEYEIGGITIKGTQYLDPGAIINISGLSVGETVSIPGEKIARAIENLWKQGLFSEIKIASSKSVSSGALDRVNTIFLDIIITEKPRLSRFSFMGVTKSEADDIREKINLVKGKPVTENLKQTTYNYVKEFFIEKGFLNAKVAIIEQPDTTVANSSVLIISVDKRKKVKINRINFVGNTHIPSPKLRRQLKDTKEKGRADVFQDLYNHIRFDSITQFNPKGIIRTFGNPVNLYEYISPKTRIGFFTTSKYIDDVYQGEKKNVLSKYYETGYRDASILHDTVYTFDQNSINIDITISEGRKYYFRNIYWVGNTKHTTAELSAILGIRKGEVFNQSTLESKLFMNPEGRDVSSLYLDDGYLFFSITPVEIAVENDSIDLELRIYEGKQATIDKVTVVGNSKTNDRVIMREIRTKPGQLFSRSDIIRSQRELAQLGYFDPEKMNVNPQPNPTEGTVDIEYTVEEKPSDQIELSGGWGAGQLVGTLGVSFNNFSGRNLFKGESWSPLPSGDGQRLSLRAQTSGRYFQSYNASFTEPWLGGKKPNSLSVSAFHTDYNYNGLKRDDPDRQSMHITGGSVGFGWRLKYPDDFFARYLEFSYQYYTIQNYPNFIFTNGYANDFNVGLTYSRNSVDQPTTMYPRSGSMISLTLQVTPPYSAFRSNADYVNMSAQEKYNLIEYHKWKFNTSWFQKLVGDLVLNARSKFGFIGSYNDNIEPAIGRFWLGGSGLSGFSLDGREIIALRGYPDYYVTPRGLNTAGNYGAIGGTVFDKFTMELRYPISLNPSSTIYVLGFAEAGNNWLNLNKFKPFDLKRSAGIGVRITLPMFGQLGLDYGWGFDRETIQSPNAKPKGEFHFSIGQSIE